MNAFCTSMGCHAPNTHMKSTSCYIISHNKKLLILDVGQFVKTKIIKYICSSKQEIDEIIIIISHNHLDHVVGLISLGKFLHECFPSIYVKIYMSNTSENYINWYQLIRKKYENIFDILVIEENTNFKFSDFNVSFAKTNHCSNKLNSFATKISDGVNSFVYTSDISSIDDNIKRFIKDVDIVMVDAGNPVERRKTLKGYHGKTKEIVSNILNLGVKCVYLTHLKACFDEFDYINSLEQDSKDYVYLVNENIKFNIFTGKQEIKYVKYSKKEIPVVAV